MPQTVRTTTPAQTDKRPGTAGLLTTGDAPRGRWQAPRTPLGEAQGQTRGFGAGKARPQKRKTGRRSSPALSKGDWGPLGKHPDLAAIVARQRLHLPRSGRLTAAQVNQAWKRCASEHHPDRGGAHDTMQLVNGARDLLLGRDLS